MRYMWAANASKLASSRRSSECFSGADKAELAQFLTVITNFCDKPSCQRYS